METYEFDTGMRRLVDVYSERAFPGERRTMIFNIVKNLTRDQWHKIVSSIIASSRQAPMVDDICEALEILGRQKQSDKIGDCKICGGYGSLLAMRENCNYGFRCNCIAGDILAGGLTQWTEGHVRSGYRL